MPEFPNLSRRSFVQKATIGAAAAGALVAAGPLISKADAGSSSRAAELPEALVAQVTDLASGTVHLYMGTKGVTIVDHALAQSLAKAAPR